MSVEQHYRNGDLDAMSSTAQLPLKHATESHYDMVSPTEHNIDFDTLSLQLTGHPLRLLLLGKGP
jgi:hypothetical protein